MFGIDLIFYICLVILAIEIYNETFLMNYGSFIERIKYLFSFKMVFKTIKLTAFTFILYMLYKYQFEGVVINDQFLRAEIFKFNSTKFYIYFIPVILYSFCIILSNSLEILRQFSLDEFNKGRLIQFIAYLSFIIYRIIAFVFTYIIFALTFYCLMFLDNLFLERELSIFDWLSPSSEQNINYNDGVYFSLILTLFIFFLFNNAFIKLKSNYKSIDASFFAYFFISIILSIGIFFGFFSIFNAYHNIKATSLTEWISKENILGILPIRLASVFILFNLFEYIYYETLERKLILFMILAIFPVRNIESYNLTINIEKRETLYFSQISFYILNIAIAEYFIIIEFKNVWISILNFAILFIQDDFKIIDAYSEGMQSVMLKHFRKIHALNLLMFLSAIIILFVKESYLILSLYLFFSSVLIFLYLFNYSFINSRDYKF